MVVRHAPGLHVFLWRALVYFGLFSCVEAVEASALDTRDRLVGQVDKASASRQEDPGFESHLRRDFTGSSHTSDLKIGPPVTTLPGAWRYGDSAGTGRLGVSIL